LEIAMPPKKNPLNLNPLQLKTLALFQELARYPELASHNEEGEAFLSQIPHPHGDHFHIGRKTVASRDATGLSNQAAWVALERKGLIRSGFPDSLVLTKDGLAYQTGVADEILHGSHH
jgi:hypothetical protein